jgi:hypothetical protein
MIRDLVLQRYYRGLLNYLDAEREKHPHVTDFIYGCARFAKWVYEDRLADVPRRYNERDLMTLAVGKKLDEIVVGDYHHVGLRLRGWGDELFGEIDDVIIDDRGKIFIILDKKTVRQKPPKVAHSHYINQVEFYYAMLYGGALVYRCGNADGDRVAEHVGRAFKDYKRVAVILYIDVSAESVWQLSNVVEWEMTDDRLGKAYERLRMLYEESLKPLPKPSYGWFCNTCPFFRRCVEAGVGDG